MAQSGTTGFLPSAAEAPCWGDGCMYYIAVVAQHYKTGDPPPVFEISLQTAGKLNLVPCASSSDGMRVVNGKMPLDGPVPRTYYGVCTVHNRTATTALSVSYEQCFGNTTLYISDTEPLSGRSQFQSLLPNSTNWGHRLSQDSTCSRAWGPQHRRIDPPKCSNPSSPALLLANHSTADRFYFLATGYGAYKITMQDGQAPPVKLHIAGPAGDLTLKGRSWASSSINRPVRVPGPISIEWGRANALTKSGNISIAHLEYFVYIVDLDRVKAEGGGHNFHFNTLCGLQSAVAYLSPYAITVRTFAPQDDKRTYGSIGDSSSRSGSIDSSSGSSSSSSSNKARELYSVDVTVPNGHMISVTVVAVCNESCMYHSAPSPCAYSNGCQSQSIVYTPLIVLSNRPPDNRPVFGRLFIFTFWVAVTALLFMLVVGLKLMHDRGILSDILRRSPREAASLSTPYADSLGDGNVGWWRRWGGYAQLSFTEMVETSTFGVAQGSRPQSGDGEGVPQLSRRDILIEQGTSLLSTAREGVSVAAAGAVSLLRTVGGALSDTASAVLARYGTTMQSDDYVRDSDIDRSTHPLNTSSYRPPSPVPLAFKSTTSSASTSSQANDSSAFIAMTAIYPDTADAKEPSAYISFPSRDKDKAVGEPARGRGSSTDRRGARTAAIEDEEEDSQETL